MGITKEQLIDTVGQVKEYTDTTKLSKTFTGVDVANKVLSTDETGNVVLKNGGDTGTAGKSAYEIAIDNGFTSTETEWLESLKGSNGVNGANGTTPHIDETTKNWFIGDTDTGILAQGTNGKDGKSIKSITKDKNNNIGNGLWAEVSDFGKYVTVVAGYHNTVSGRSSTKHFIIVFQKDGVGTIFTSSTKWRTISGVGQAASYIKSLSGAIESSAANKI